VLVDRDVPLILDKRAVAASAKHADNSSWLFGGVFASFSDVSDELLLFGTFLFLGTALATVAGGVVTGATTFDLVVIFLTGSFFAGGFSITSFQ
jgi:hypothetical protein